MPNIGDVELKDSAESYVEQIRKHKSVMDNIFNTFTDSVKRLKSKGGFESPAGSAFYNKYQMLEGHYNEFITLFEEFAMDYETAIGEVNRSDVKTQSAAEGLKNVQ